MLDSVFENAELDCNAAGHFDSAAEGNFAVALGEVEVSNTELGAGDVDGEVDFAAAGEVLDVAVAAVLYGSLVSLLSLAIDPETMSALTSGLPGTVLAPSLPTFSLILSSAEPACTLIGCGG